MGWKLVEIQIVHRGLVNSQPAGFGWKLLNDITHELYEEIRMLEWYKWTNPDLISKVNAQKAILNAKIQKLNLAYKPNY